MALLEGAVKRKTGRVGRPSKANMGLGQNDRPAWMHYRDCVVLVVVERERSRGRTMGESALSAIAEWKRRAPAAKLSLKERKRLFKDAWKRHFPTDKLSETEVDNIMARGQPADLPGMAWRVVEQVELWPETEIIDGKLQLTGRMVDIAGLCFRVDERPNYSRRGSGKKRAFVYSRSFTLKPRP